MNSRKWQRAGLAILAGLALLAPAARAANDEQQNKPKKDTSLRIMPLNRDRGFGTDPESLRINPLSRDRVFTRPPRTMIFATEPRDMYVPGASTITTRDWGSGGFSWVDSTGRHSIIPSDPCDRWLLEHGFVPDSVLSLYYHHRQGNFDVYVPIQVPQTPDVTVYNQVVVVPVPVQAPQQQQNQNLEVLQPKAPAKTEQDAATPAPVEASFASPLSSALGGNGREGDSFALGESHMKSGDLARAVESLQRAVMQKPDDPVVVLALGIAELGQANVADAARYLRKGLGAHRDPNLINVELRNLLGGDAAYRERVAALLESVQKNPDDGEAHFLLGFIYFADSDWANAAAQWREVERLDQADVVAARMRALAMGRLAKQQQVQQK